MQCRWQVEIDPFCQQVLQKHWPGVRRYGDITKVSGGELEQVDLVCGGFPCQPVSLAGRRKAQKDKRWLWPEFFRIVREVRPLYVLVENVPGLRSAGIWMGGAMGEVLGDLAKIGYDAEWDCIPACAIGAHHIRDRIFIVAYPSPNANVAGARFESWESSARRSVWDKAWRAESERRSGIAETNANSHEVRRGRRSREKQQERWTESQNSGIFTNLDLAGLAKRQKQVMLEQLATAERSTPADPDGEPLVRAAIARGECHAWTVEPGVVRMVHGVPDRVDRVRALGNAVVPQVVELIGQRLMEITPLVDGFIN